MHNRQRQIQDAGDRRLGSELPRYGRGLGNGHSTNGVKQHQKIEGKHLT
ncbi:MAG: hypothetical protein GPJ21_01390 [Microcystis aeruginosa W13-11]|nr:hypothetical protein [Microcystis aeruginosa W13-11]